MLSLIPFFASLLNKPLPNGKRSTNSYVLVYGAVEAHSMGAKGCIASNKKIAAETGLKEGSVAVILSVLAKAGWIRVELDENNHRKRIDPLMVINPPLIGIKPPLESGLNIDNSIIENNSAADAADAPKEKNEILRLFYLVIKKYGLPVLNHNHIRKWAKDLEQLPDGEAYLRSLVDNDLRQAEGEFRPTLNTASDVIQKKLKIQRFLNDGEDKVPRDPRVFGGVNGAR